MATPFSITQNFKNGGIRQGKVYVVENGSGSYLATSLGRIKEPYVNLKANESDPDAQGRTTVISFALDAAVTLMQHTHAEIAAVGAMAFPPDGSDEEGGYHVLFTDGPISKTEVEAALNDAGGRIIPGILLENVFPKPSPNINFGTEDSMIQITMNGILKPDALVTFDTDPVLTFAV